LSSDDNRVLKVTTCSEIQVLHVDDDKSFLELAKTILSDEGSFVIHTATCVEEALIKIQNSSFDVIISDYEMPQKNGLDFLKLLQEKDVTTPFILFTGKGREEIVVQALNLGVDRYISKHGDPQTVYTELAVAIRQLYEKSRAQKLLWESEERWNFALEGSGHGVWDLNVITKELFLSKRWKQILGYEENELKNDVTEWKNRMHPLDKQKAIQAIEDFIAGKSNSYVKNYRLMSKDGSYKKILSQAKIVARTTDGKASRIIGTIMDITEHARAKSALKESEAKFSAAFYSSGVALVISRLDDGLILEVNDCFLDIFGFTREEVVGKTSQQLNLYADITERQKIIKLTLNNQPVINREVKGLKKDKTTATVLLSTKPFYIKGQKHLLTTIIDITELKNTEKALFLRQKELENFISIAPDAVTIFDLNGKIIECNELSGKTFGYNREEILGTYVVNYVFEKDKKRMEIELQNALYDKQVHTTVLAGRHRSGIEICLEASVKAVFDQQGNPTAFIAIIRDITERKLTERKLKESEERYRFVAEHAHDLITVTDPIGLFDYVSPSIKNLTGFESAELVNKKSVLDFIHPEDQKIVIENCRNLLENNEALPTELRFLTKNDSYIWLEANISKVKDANGSNKFITISRDVTQRKIDFEEKVIALDWAELLLNKLSVVGGFVRHDVRNKLTIINSVIYLCKKYAKSTNNEFMINHIKQVEHASKSIERILEFSQTYETVGSQGLSWYSINKIIESAKTLFLDVNTIEIVTENTDFEALADSALIEIFHNLIDNSIKYGKNLKKIQIYSQTNANKNLELIYEDNGGGIDPEIKASLFQKGAGKGTGLGLYLIQRICEIYGWQVYENGEFGVGVRFIIEIPREKIKAK